MKLSVNFSGILAAVAALAVLSSSTTRASTTGYVTPGFRGSLGASYDGWEKFTVPVGAPGNKADLAGSFGFGVFTQNEPNAVMTGTGNIYDQNFKGDYSLSYQLGAPIQQVVFQVRTAGNELDYASVSLSYDGGSLSVTRVETDRTSFGGPPGTPGSGFAVSSAYEFDLSGLDVKSFQIGFKAADVSVSLDSVALDVKTTIPEPGTWALAAAGIALVAFGGWRRR